MKDSLVLGVLSVLALCGMAAIAYQQRGRAFIGANDFMPLYAGPVLLESGELYDNDRLLAIVYERTGSFSPEQGFIRFPFHAALLYPLSLLPYRTAYLIWTALSFASIVGFVVLWRLPQASVRTLMYCMSVPLTSILLNGQDVGFLLLVVALTARLHERGNEFAAGLAFSICAAKFHLFLLTPVWILARRDWPFLKGLLAGGGALAGISFAVAGWDWPLEWLASALNDRFSPGLSAMPNLHGALSKLPAAFVWEAVASAIVVAAVWIAARRGEFHWGFGAALAGGLLLSRHSYMLDTAVLLPTCLTIMALSNLLVLRILAFVPLVPVWAMLVGSAYPYSALATAVAAALLLGMAWESWGEVPVSVSLGNSPRMPEGESLTLGSAQAQAPVAQPVPVRPHTPSDRRLRA